MGSRAIFILLIFAVGAFKTLQSPQIGIIFFTVLTYIRPERLSYNQLAQYRLFMVISLLLLASYFLNSSKIQKIQNHSKVIICLVLLAFLQLFISPFAVYDTEISWEWSITFVKIIIFCFLMVKILTTEKSIRWFLTANFIGVAFVGIWGFQQHFLGNPRLEKVAGGQFDESNSVGTLCALFVPIILSLFFVFKDWKRKSVVLLLTMVLFADVFFTQSRSALLGVIAGLLLFVLYLPAKHKIIFLLLGLLSIPFVQKIINSTEGYKERIEATASGRDKGADRLGIWQAGLVMIQEHPFTGVGIRNFRYLAKGYCEKLGIEHGFHRLADAHNNVLLIFAEAGVFGGVLLLLAYLFHFLDIRYLKKRWKASENYLQYIPFLNGLQCGMVAFYVSSLFHSYPYGEPFYWFLLVPGLMRNVYEKRKTVEAHCPMSV